MLIQFFQYDILRSERSEDYKDSSVFSIIIQRTAIDTKINTLPVVTIWYTHYTKFIINVT